MPRPTPVPSLAVLLLCLALLPASSRAQPVSAIPLTVDTPIDSNAPTAQICSGSPGDCSLRGAISKANAETGTDYLIILPAGIYDLYIAGTSEDDNAQGDLDIKAPALIISGAGEELSVIDADYIDRVMTVFEGARLEIHGITIRNGRAPGESRATDGDHGGGIYNEGSVAMYDSTVSGNAAGGGGDVGYIEEGPNGGHGGKGGGIYNTGTMTLTGSTVFDNAAGAGGSSSNHGAVGGDGGGGGGIYSSGTMTLTHSTVSDNASGRGGNGSVGVGSAYGGDGGCGGGLYSQGRLLLDQSTVSRNNTGQGGAATGRDSGIAGNGGPGAGICADGGLGSGRLTLTDSTVTANSTGNGGEGTGLSPSGIGYGGDGGTGGGLKIDGGVVVSLLRGTVSENTTGAGGTASGPTAELGEGGRGGGLFSGEANPSLVDVLIDANTAGYHGGGMYSYLSDPVLTGVHFSRNSVTAGYGGAMYNEGGTPVLIRAAFTEHALGSGEGGAIYNDGSNLTLINSTFTGNWVLGGGKGGAISSASSTLALVNALFAGNYSNSYGGAIYNRDSELTVTNSTFADNESSWGEEYGHAIYNQGSGAVVVRNSIFWGRESVKQFDWNTTAPDVRYSDVQGGIPGGTGNKDEDPQFLRDPDPGDDHWATWDDNDYGDLRLVDTSPVIDAANNTAVPPDTYDLDGDGNTTEPVPLDLRGAVRFWNAPDVPDSGVGPPPVVDMGASEYSIYSVYLPLVVRAP